MDLISQKLYKFNDRTVYANDKVIFDRPEGYTILGNWIYDIANAVLSDYFFARGYRGKALDSEVETYTVYFYNIICTDWISSNDRSSFQNICGLCIKEYLDAINVDIAGRDLMVEAYNKQQSIISGAYGLKRPKAI
jgi:hypothetical protein